jgi:hypothetical protein
LAEATIAPHPLWSIRYIGERQRRKHPPQTKGVHDMMGKRMSLWKHAIPSALRRGFALALNTGLVASACLGVTALTAVAATGATGAQGTARAARVASVNDSASLHTADPNSTSSTIIEEGGVTGTLPGTVRARFAVGVSVVNVGFTIYLHGGSISGEATAKLNPGKGEYASFAGTLKVNHGSGRYAHAVGSGQVYGTLNHYSYNSKVQVIGQLHY